MEEIQNRFQREIDNMHIINEKRFGSCKGLDFKCLLDKNDLNYNADIYKFSQLGLNSNEPPKESIPFILHYVWTGLKDNLGTVKKMPYKNEFIISKTLSNIGDDWKIYFWTNDLKSLPEPILDNNKIEKKIYSEEFNNFTEYFFKLSKNIYYLSPLSDLLRGLVVQKYGGLYLDADYRLCKKVDNLLVNYDFVIGQEWPECNHCGANGFLAAHPNHPIINEFISDMIRNLNYNTAPEYLKTIQSYQKWVMLATGPLALNLAFYKKAYSDNNKDTMLPCPVILNNHANKILKITPSSITSDKYCESLHSSSYGNDAYSSSWTKGHVSLIAEIYDTKDEL
jgi:hypothetical protein